MIPIIQFALSSLKSFWRVVSLMVVFFACAVFALLLLVGYRDLTENLVQIADQSHLVVHESDTSAEFYGSQISASIGDELRKAGVSWTVPAIHSATGTLGRNFQFILGVDLENYTSVERFTMLEGRPLAPGDNPRNAMLGRFIAQKEDASVGDVIQIRGRDFKVIGVFETRSFYDNDIWISLEEAQSLLGWGSDVSYFIVPDEGILQPGTVFTGNAVVSYRGETMKAAIQEFVNVIDLFTVIVNMLSVGTAFALGSIIFRLASIQKYHLAILRSIGFSKLSITSAFFIQAAIIFLAGYLLGLGGAFLFPLLYQFNVYDLVIKPVMSLKNILTPFMILGSLGIISIMIPLIWIYRSNLSNLLRSE